jgi:transposase-like protein
MVKYTCETCNKEFTRKLEYTRHIKGCLKSDERSDTTVEDTEDTVDTLD